MSSREFPGFDGIHTVKPILPGSDQPQIESGLPRWSTILSPKLGLKNGRGLEAADGIA